MKQNLSLLNQEVLVNQLYSLTGPQENLPSILQQILGLDMQEVNSRLSGLTNFSSKELTKIHDRFQNTALHISKIA